jgi:deoxyribonuclease-2
LTEKDNQTKENKRMLHAIDDSGSPVDWWFMYKLPRDANSPTKSGSTKPSTGFEYLYFDSESKKPVARSSNLLTAKEGALYNTLMQLYPTSKNPNDGLGWIFYNDERCDDKPNDDEKGHTKGVLAFNTKDDSAFWLLHSTPRFALTAQADFPQDERDYAQTYLCITLKDVATANSIAAQMYTQQEPQLYCWNEHGTIPTDSNFYKLTQGVNVNEQDPPSKIEFYSKGGQQFYSIAKNRHWDKDFWNDLVGPELKVDLDVETWRRGTLASTKDSDDVHDITDVLYINLEALGVDYEWHYTQDHSKWAISTSPDWVCVGDINRDKSQEKRGGGTICFQNKELWQALSQVEKLKQE